MGQEDSSRDNRLPRRILWLILRIVFHWVSASLIGEGEGEGSSKVEWSPSPTLLLPQCPHTALTSMQNKIIFLYNIVAFQELIVVLWRAYILVQHLHESVGQHVCFGGVFQLFLPISSTLKFELSTMVKL